jgi:hypothetical protein
VTTKSRSVLYVVKEYAVACAETRNQKTEGCAVYKRRQRTPTEQKKKPTNQ